MQGLKGDLFPNCHMTGFNVAAHIYMFTRDPGHCLTLALSLALAVSFLLPFIARLDTIFIFQFSNQRTTFQLENK